MTLKYSDDENIHCKNQIVRIIYSNKETNKMLDIVRLLVRKGWIVNFFLNNETTFIMSGITEFLEFKKDYENALKVVEGSLW